MLPSLGVVGRILLSPVKADLEEAGDAVERSSEEDKLRIGWLGPNVPAWRADDTSDLEVGACDRSRGGARGFEDGGESLKDTLLEFGNPGRLEAVPSTGGDRVIWLAEASILDVELVTDRGGLRAFVSLEGDSLVSSRLS